MTDEGMHLIKLAFDTCMEGVNHTPPKHISTISLRVVRPSAFSFSTRYRAKSSMRKPWPTSPNMTANRKGNVTMVKICDNHITSEAAVIKHQGPS
jgi:hypothetical protein